MAFWATSVDFGSPVGVWVALMRAEGSSVSLVLSACVVELVTRPGVTRGNSTLLLQAVQADNILADMQMHGHGHCTAYRAHSSAAITYTIITSLL